MLNQEGYDFVFIPKTSIDEGIPNGHLLKELALFSKNSTYTIYDFLETPILMNEIVQELKLIK